MKLSITKDTITPAIIEVGTRGSYNIEPLELTFDDYWTGKNILIKIDVPDGPDIEDEITSDTYTIPKQIMDLPGDHKFIFSEQVAEGETLIEALNTYPAVLRVGNTLLPGGEWSDPAVVALYTQMKQTVDASALIVTDIQTRVNSGEFDGVTPAITPALTNTDDVYQLEIEDRNGTHLTENIRKKITLRKNDTFFQIEWKYTDEADTSYRLLIPYSAITGPQGIQGVQGIQGIQGETGSQGIQGIQGIPGETIELTNDGTNIKWRVVGDVEWTNVVALSAIKGDTGTVTCETVNVLPETGISGKVYRLVSGVTIPMVDGNGDPSIAFGGDIEFLLPSGEAVGPAFASPLVYNYGTLIIPVLSVTNDIKNISFKINTSPVSGQTVAIRYKHGTEDYVLTMAQTVTAGTNTYDFVYDTPLAYSNLTALEVYIYNTTENYSGINEFYPITIQFDGVTSYWLYDGAWTQVGKDGEKPEKGVDYYDTTDKEELVSDAVTSLQTKVYVNAPVGGTTVTLPHNTEIRYLAFAATDLTIEFPAMPADSGTYQSSIVFFSESSATSLTYPATIKWSGVDVVDGVYVPLTNAFYDIYFKWNGLYLIANVSRFDI